MRSLRQKPTVSPFWHVLLTMGVKKTIQTLIKAGLMLRKMIICYFIFSIFFTGPFQMNHARVTDEFGVKILLPDSDMRSHIPQVL